jgi:hypothetical protein
MEWPNFSGAETSYGNGKLLGIKLFLEQKKDDVETWRRGVLQSD